MEVADVSYPANNDIVCHVHDPSSVSKCIFI